MLVLSALIFYINPRALLEEFTQVRLMPVGSAALAIVVSTFLGSINSHLLLSRSGEISWRQFLPIYWVGWALSLVVPGQVGDVAGISALLRRHGLDWHTSIGRSLVDKVISLAVSFLFGIVALTQISAVTEQINLANSTTFGSVVLVLGIISVGAVLIVRSQRPAAGKLREFMFRISQEFSYTVRNHPLRLCINTCLTIVKIVFSGLAYFYAFQAFGYSELALLPVIGLAATSSIVAYIPISFNGLGTAELAGVALFSAIGIASSAVLSAYLTLRCVVMLLAWIPAGGWLLIRHDSTSQALR